MAFPQVIGVTQTDGVTTGTEAVSFTIPSAARTGDLLYMFVSQVPNTGMSTPTDWTLDGSYYELSTMRLYSFTKTMSEAEALTQEITINTAFTNWNLCVVAIRDGELAGIDDEDGFNEDTSIATPSDIATVDDESLALICLVGTKAIASTPTLSSYDAGAPVSINQRTNAVMLVAFDEYAEPTDPITSYTATVSATVDTVGRVVIVKPTAAAAAAAADVDESPETPIEPVTTHAEDMLAMFPRKYQSTNWGELCDAVMGAPAPWTTDDTLYAFRGNAGSIWAQTLTYDVALNFASASTATVYPGAGHLMLLSVISYGADQSAQPPPVVTGCGTTWEVVETEIPDGGVMRLTVYRAMNNSASSGIITITASSLGNLDAAWTLVEFGGVDRSGTNGSGAIRQSVIVSDGDGGNMTMTLASAVHPVAPNAAYVVEGCYAGITVLTGESSINTGWRALTAQNDASTASWIALADMWRTAAVVSELVSTSGSPPSEIVGCLLEIKASGGAVISPDYGPFICPSSLLTTVFGNSNATEIETNANAAMDVGGKSVRIYEVEASALTIALTPEEMTDLFDTKQLLRLEEPWTASPP